MLDHLAEFFGRTHIVVLHFPIALLIVAAFVELLRALNPQRTAMRYRPGPAGTTMFVFALLACTYTVISGLILGFGEPAKVDLHRILGIATGVLVLLTAIPLITSQKPDPGNAPRLYLAMLIISAGAVAFTGHLGGDLTHGKGYITRPLAQIFQSTQSPKPEPIPSLNPADFDLTQAQLDTYLDTIQPIFDNHCIECHGADEAEDDIRLDALNFVLDPDHEIVVRGDPVMSDLVYLIELPAGDPDIMPPEDEGTPLSAEQIQAIRAWVESLGN
jgi:mono/diheme cytochrome c family protein